MLHMNSIQERFGRLHHSKEGPDKNSNNRGFSIRARIAFVLGGLSACVRFTSLAAWVPIGLIIAHRNGKSGRSSVGKTEEYHYGHMLSTLFGLCGAYGLIGVIFGCCIDCWFYGFWAVPFLGNIHFNVLLGKFPDAELTQFVLILNFTHMFVSCTSQRPWISLRNSPILVVCVCGHSGHLWNRATIFSVGDWSIDKCGS